MVVVNNQLIYDIYCIYHRYSDCQKFVFKLTELREKYEALETNLTESYRSVETRLKNFQEEEIPESLDPVLSQIRQMTKLRISTNQVMLTT